MIYLQIFILISIHLLEKFEEGDLITFLYEMSCKIFSRLHLFAVLPMVEDWNDGELKNLTASLASITCFALPFTLAFAVVMLGFGVLVFLTYLAFYIPDLLHRTFSSKKAKGLDLQLDNVSIDWTGRVLDIVKRVNSRTSSEVASLKRDNTKIRKDNEKFLKDNARIINMMEAIMVSQNIPLPPVEGGVAKTETKTMKPQAAQMQTDRKTRMVDGHTKTTTTTTTTKATEGEAEAMTKSSSAKTKTKRRSR